MAGRGEELPIALISSVDGAEHDGSAVHREQRAYCIELGGEDLEDDEGKAELGERGPHVCPLERALRCSDLHQSSMRRMEISRFADSMVTSDSIGM